MNSSFKVSSPSTYLDLGAPSALLPTHQVPNAPLQLYFQPLLSGSLNPEGISSPRQLPVEPYALSVYSQRRRRRHQRKDSTHVRRRISSSEDEPHGKRPRLVFGLIPSRGPSEESQSKEDAQEEEEEVLWIKLGSGQVIKAPKRLLPNIEMTLKEREAAAESRLSSLQALPSLPPPPRTTKIPDPPKKILPPLPLPSPVALKSSPLKASSGNLVMRPIMMEKPPPVSPLPPSHIIALKTNDKKGGIIYLKSLPNPSKPAPRLLFTGKGPQLKLLPSSLPGPRPPPTMTTKTTHAMGGVSSSSQKQQQQQLVVKRLLPPVKKSLTNGSGGGHQQNGKYRDIMKLSSTLKHVLSQCSETPREEEDPLPEPPSTTPTFPSSSSKPVADHDYSLSPRGAKLSEVLGDISKRGICVETTAVNGLGSKAARDAPNPPPLEVLLPQKDLLAYTAAVKSKETPPEDKPKKHPSPMPGNKKRTLPRRLSTEGETLYVDEALPPGWFAHSLFDPGIKQRETFFVSPKGIRLRAGWELSNYVRYGSLPYLENQGSHLTEGRVSIQELPVRRAAVVLERLPGKKEITA